MSNIEKLVVSIDDVPKINIKDRLAGGKITSAITDNSINPMGKVSIYSKDLNNDKPPELIRESSNLVTASGRHWLVQRALNSAKAETGINNWFITHVALGTGGCVPGQPLVPLAPQLGDVTLGSQLASGSSSARIQTVGGQQYHMIDSEYPIYTVDGTIPSSSLNGTVTLNDTISGTIHPRDRFLVGILQTTIGADSFNGGYGDTDFQDVNEAGLYITDSKQTPTVARLFARVCFSTIRKTNDRELTFVWRVYF